MFSRTFAALAVVAGMVAPELAGAQDLPDLKLMAPASPGGGWDQTSRGIAQALQDAGLANSVQVTNVPGAGGTIGIARFVNEAKGDPSQLMASGFVMVGAINLHKSPVTLNDVTPIARVTGEWQAVAVPASSDIKSVADLAEKIKADPGAVSWAGGSAGGPDHILAALIVKEVGADPRKTNYIAFSGGGEAMGSLLGGKVTVGVNSLSELTEQVEAGKLRLIAVASPERLSLAPDAPTFIESGVDVELSNWRMVVAGPGISDEEKAKLVAMFEKLHASEPWKKLLKDRGWDDAFLTGDKLDSFLAKEKERVAAVLKEVGLVK
jgi:putative tricarboxylic transport membrane protein